MKRVVLDTDIIIDYSKGYADWLSDSLLINKTKVTFIVPTIVISEYFASHILEDKKLSQAADDLFGLFRKQDFNEDIAKILAGILRHKKYSPGAGLADLIIASTTLYLDAELATRNSSDFSKIPNLRLFDKPKESK